jgi:membrane protease YdiL (CAAX protease family)
MNFFILVYLPILIDTITTRKLNFYGIIPKKPGLNVKLLVMSSFIVLLFIFAGFFLKEHWWGILPQFNFVAKNLPAIILFQVLVVAFPEEFFFRGFLQTRFGQKNLSCVRFSQAIKSGSVYISAGLFTIFHCTVDFSLESVLIFFPGFLFALLKVMSGGIFASIFLHSFSNVSSLLLASALTN